MKLQNSNLVVRAIWAVLLVAFVAALALQRWSIAFVSLATLGISMLPLALAARMHIRLPTAFLVFIVFFVFATLFLGEVFDFYERYWWWDILLHGSSAIGFGLIGFLFIFALFEGDLYAAPAWAIALISACFAVAIGAVWEIFEFAMDQTFGTNMQKSGLMDTMADLIVYVIGSAIGGISGFLYLKGRERGGLFAWLIAEFVDKNRRLFRRKKR